jgi:hypothetical protein
VLDVVDLAGRRGLVAPPGPLAVLVAEDDGIADPGRDGLAVPDVQRQARPAQPGAELPAPIRNDASPPGPDMRSAALVTDLIFGLRERGPEDELEQLASEPFKTRPGAARLRQALPRR